MPTPPPGPIPPLPAAERLQAWLRQQLPHWPDVQWAPHLGSTNSHLMQASGLALPALQGTHWQQQGRGRAGRAFLTPAGSALTFSCAFATRLPTAALPTMSIWLAVAACEALREAVPEPAQLRLKWPNDLNWGDAKLAGMLLESGGSLPDGTTRLVIGIGLNLQAGAALSHRLERAIAGWADTGSTMPAPTLVVRLASQWQAALAIAAQHWQPDTGLALLPDRFQACDALRHRAIHLLEHGDIRGSGVAEGVNAFGRLQLRTPQGLQSCSVGDVSVRPQP